MIWVGWRQFRGQAIAAAAVLLVVAIVLVVTGVHLEHLYTSYKANIHTCNALSCEAVRSRLLDTYHHVRLLGSLLIGLPAILGLFWGAPLVTRELDASTHRLAWTQSVTRTRWIATKLAIVGLASMLVAGLFSLAMSWWAMPYDQVNANHLSPAIFDQRGIVPMAYAAFAFVLGVTIGLLVRRTLPAMALTVVGFVAARMLTQYYVRPHFFAPVRRALSLSPSLGLGLNLQNGIVSIDAGHPNLHAGWVTSSKLVDASGHSPSNEFLRQACAAAMHVPPPTGGGTRVHAGRAADQAFTSCISNVGARYHEVLAYQPNSRFWEFQWAEFGLFIGLALLLAVACVGLVRRRLA